jgi:hypothetical protein
LRKKAAAASGSARDTGREKMQTVKVLNKENQHFVVVDGDDRFHAIVPQNQLEFGGLHIIEGTVKISNELFEKWFADDLKIIRDKTEMRNKLIDKYRSLLLGNIELLLNRYDFILTEEKYRNLYALSSFSTEMYAGKSCDLSLGDILALWKNDKNLSIGCTCGSKAYIYHFGGNPMSGVVFHWWAYCPHCSHTLEGGPAAGYNKANKNRNGIPDETIYSVKLPNEKALWGYFKHLPENRINNPIFDLEIFEKLIDLLKTEVTK